MTEDQKLIINRTLLIFGVLIVSSIFPNITLVMSISGSICGTLISIIFPVLLFNKAYENSKKKSRLRKINYLVLTIGAFFGTLGFI